jgi:hypothetical protein
MNSQLPTEKGCAKVRQGGTGKTLHNVQRRCGHRTTGVLGLQGGSGNNYGDWDKKEAIFRENSVNLNEENYVAGPPSNRAFAD